MENRYDPRKSCVNAALIVLNLLYFVFLTLHGNTAYDLDMMVKYGAIYEPLIIEEHQYYRLLTACFMHFGIEHLVNNMVVLFVVGEHLERALGHVKYLLLYLAAGIGANIFSCGYHVMINDFVVAAGASGAIFGVVGGLLWAVLRNRGRLEDLSAVQLIVLAVLSIYLGYADGGVDNAAHIGGFLCGFVLSMLLYRKKRYRGRSNVWEYE